MKLLVLGATGRTGKEIVKVALNKGHDVKVIARDLKQLEEFKVGAVLGTPYDYETVDKAVKGCDTVINTLNVSRKTDNPWTALRAPKDLISKSASNAIKAMDKYGVKRFVALSTIGAGTSWKDSPAILRLLVSISNLKVAFQDHGRQEELLKNSHIDYTICRAPMLSDEPNGKAVVATKEGEKPESPKLSRNSAANFFISIIENNDHIREVIHISNKK
jgi:uncharacterized protein YbjT (DUF2867 family)